ncbi:MAG: DUF4499 domain-containing protein [Deltaproteobacteria bacterium]|nr:DUF4499 domain-containing protein [Deltaproteobacteria bacterium]
MAISDSLAGGSERVERPHVGWWISVLGGMGLLALVAFDAGAYARWCELVTPALPRGLLQGVFIAAVVAHLVEGAYAFRLAQHAGLHASAAGWLAQTCTLGYPSLRLLRRRLGATRA